ncbi:MAG: Methyltransferase-like protein [Candidatus Beckwithbacteria bacterium GW2011_GWB1_47_15]|uniref:Methyltransferase-like protein n=1 Tax=Candidatus Beckwithbacteria bacterium GW2011_GWB1_47_15 TaxID=1618371 RepID=A0A0G1RW23_9BACT|nr:MAG: methyltransferase-like protein [Candidatus Beckwithbacteria bacterium GW2011_GWC1_49_16]KKU34949.1 MAG: Methyltransferase-like protein [Candidatus Beckwithbacteria bacterium GW2011_GWA1_46_30]KKU61342.1 MAG: Methyltransferase-like protein [Candidatus Beckwithbacteria bacterium GW2011_GWB1_47_15]KKU71387.1 MAG: Methyltransferase-like protein [Candidatus Beckwithbacteria bacterium GW2011_GWA2_47_25]OGD57641.1 MAG: hypothetical protein A3J22_03945 [Candidatus Beckwithbacteria bacterium RIF
MSKDHQTLNEFVNRFWYVPSDIVARLAEALVWQERSFKKPVLDIGCGDGSIGELIFKGKVIDMGIDLNQKAIETAADSDVYKKTRAADATKLPFKNNSYQTVVSNSTFEHINDDVQAVKEAYRVLEPGGYLYLTVPTDKFEAAVARLARTEKNLARINQRLAHYHYHSLKDWRVILKRTGFQTVEFKYFFPERMVNVWYRFFRLVTFKPNKRELWSYLSDDRFKRFMPKKLIKVILFKYFQGFYGDLFSKKGCLLFIKALKR